MDSKKKNCGDLALPTEPLERCPLGNPECLEDQCPFFQELDDWKGCGLRLAEAVIKEFMGEGARWLDDILGLSSKGPKQ